MPDKPKMETGVEWTIYACLGCLLVLAGLSYYVKPQYEQTVDAATESFKTVLYMAAGAKFGLSQASKQGEAIKINSTPGGTAVSTGAAATPNPERPKDPEPAA